MTTEERAELAVERKQIEKTNCCQAVLVVLADQTGLPEDLLKSMGSGFGVGMGNMEGTCGALVGAVMAAGLHSPGKGAAPAARAISDSFYARCGARICKDLKRKVDGVPVCACEDCVRNAVRAYGEVVGLA